MFKFPVCKAVSAVYQSSIYQNNLERLLNHSSSTNIRYLIHPQKCHIICTKIKTKTIKIMYLSSQKRILLSRVMTGNGRFCSSYEVSPSSFRYYSSSVEYLTGICCPSVVWNISLFLVYFFVSIFFDQATKMRHCGLFDQFYIH